MALPHIDVLMEMSDEELDNLLEQEVALVLSSIEDSVRKQRMEAFWWKLRMRVKYESGYSFIKAFSEMCDSAILLSETWLGEGK